MKKTPKQTLEVPAVQKLDLASVAKLNEEALKAKANAVRLKAALETTRPMVLELRTTQDAEKLVELLKTAKGMVVVNVVQK